MKAKWDKNPEALMKCSLADSDQENCEECCSAIFIYLEVQPTAQQFILSTICQSLSCQSNEGCLFRGYY